MPELALIRRFPALSQIPRVSIGMFPSPVELVEVGSCSLWIKRDDRNAATVAGNKVRALEFLLAGVQEGDGVLTVGGVGSTHVLATATHAARFGAQTAAFRWPHETNRVADEIARAIENRCAESPTFSSPADAMARAMWRRATRGERWVPFGGTSPRGMLGHVNAALELAEQIDAGALTLPSEVYVPLGSGGTAAGLALGFAMAGLPTTVIAVRCGPRLGVDDQRLEWLAWRASRFIARISGPARPPAKVVFAPRLRIFHGAYAGRYGRPHPESERSAAELSAVSGIRLDATYSAKACYAALTRAATTRVPVLLWQTFDGRWMEAAPEAQLVRHEER